MLKMLQFFIEEMVLDALSGMAGKEKPVKLDKLAVSATNLIFRKGSKQKIGNKKEMLRTILPTPPPRCTCSECYKKPTIEASNKEGTSIINIEKGAARPAD